MKTAYSLATGFVCIMLLLRAESLVSQTYDGGNTSSSETTTSGPDGVDLLNTNANPVFNLMGIAPTDYRRPTSLQDVTATIQTFTADFTQLPPSYAVEIAPFKFYEDKSDNWLENLGVTIGYHNQSLTESGPLSTNILSLGGGLNISISDTKNKVQTTRSESKKNEINKREAQLLVFETESTKSKLNNHQLPTFKGENSDTIRRMSEKYVNQIENVIKEEKEQISKATIENTGLFPSGLFLNYSLGYVHDLALDTLAISQARSFGTWMTGGYENSDDWFSILGQLKYTYTPNFRTSTVTTEGSGALDFGGMIIINSQNQKVDFSFEWTIRHRSGLSQDNAMKKTTKYLFNLNVDVGSETKLNLTLGKNFSDDITREGNLLSLLNLVKSFG